MVSIGHLVRGRADWVLIKRSLQLVNMSVFTHPPANFRTTALPAQRAIGNDGPLTANVIAASELTGSLAMRWESIRSRSTAFATPFQSSRFVQTVGSLRSRAKVAVFLRCGDAIGFLPFESLDAHTIEPIGKAYNDAHGILCDPSQPIDYLDALRTLGVKCYRFHALSGPSVGADGFILGMVPSFLANLEAHSEGYVNYLEATRETIYKQRRKTKKLVRDLGPLRLELDCHDHNELEKLISLKRSQYQRSYIFDLLGIDWPQQMLRTLWQDRNQACRGLLSVLYAGDTMVAAHYGLLERGILHYWFPVFDPAYHQYSPGTAIFLEIANQADRLGIKKIDLGYGDQPYKHKFVDTITHAPYGCVSTCKLRLLRERARFWLGTSVKHLPAKPMLKRITRRLWTGLGQQAYV